MRGQDRLLLAAFAAVFAALVLMVAGSPKFLIFDERLHFSGVEILRQEGLSRAFLQKLIWAVGPLYAVVQELFTPLTGGVPPAIRWVNPVLLLAMICALGLAVRARGGDVAHVLMLGAVPGIWAISGMALTEIPAMLFVALALAALARGEGRGYMAAALSGLAFGIAAVGRQPYFGLPFLTVLVYLALGRWSWRHAVLHLAMALPVPLEVFITWGGLMPPIQTRNLVTQIPVPKEGVIDLGIRGMVINLDSLVPSLAYCGLYMILMAPAWARVGKGMLAMVAVAVLANGLFGFVTFKGPFESYAALPEAVRAAGSVLTPAAIVALACYFVHGLAMVIIANARDPYVVTLCLAALAIGCHNGLLVMPFTSRYTNMALPFLVVLGAAFSVSSHWRLVRFTLGSALGLVLLRNYYVTWAAAISSGIN